MRRNIIKLLPFLLIASPLLAFIIYKAVTASFTHDESYSYLHYCGNSFGDILSYKISYTNNHILNSLGMKYAEVIFGSSEWALRLPNILAFTIYAFFSFKLLKSFSYLLQLAFFSLFLYNVLLIDLFAMARGYGLSCAFMLMGLYHLIQILKQSTQKHVYLFHFGFLLAILSNFTLVTVYASSLICFIIVTYFISKNDIKTNYKTSFYKHIIPFLIVVGVLYEPLRRALTYSSLNFGGSNGFFEDTVSHLINNSVHHVGMPSLLFIFLKILVTGIVVIPLLIMIIKIYKKDWQFFNKNLQFALSTGVCFGVSIIIISLHLILKADYPIARFSIFLYPLLILQLAFVASYISSIKYPQLLKIKVVPLALFAMVSFSINTSTTQYGEWAYDSNTKQMMTDLKNNYSGNNSTLGVNWLFEPTANYYRKTLHYTWLDSITRDNIKSSRYDFIYAFENDSLPEGYKALKKYPNTQSVLIKK